VVRAKDPEFVPIGEHAPRTRQILRQVHYALTVVIADGFGDARLRSWLGSAKSRVQDSETKNAKNFRFDVQFNKPLPGYGVQGFSAVPGDVY
jgi:hypothetical protein